MESKAKLFGHPAHTILVVFPLGLLSTSVVFDGIAAVTKSETIDGHAKAMLGAGLLGGLAAAPFGTVDWLAIPSGTRAKKIGLLHGLGNVVVLGIFGASLFLRLTQEKEQTKILPRGLSLLGAGLAIMTGWLGGELVARLGVGVDDGANLDAPNSLTGLSARDETDIETPSDEELASVTPS